MDTKQHFSLWYFVGVALALLAIQSFLSGPHKQLLAYSDFQALLQAGKVKEVSIADDQLSGTADLTGSKISVDKRPPPRSSRTMTSSWRACPMRILSPNCRRRK